MEWPEKLPGLDVGEGVGRLLNNQNIYQKVLECFLEDSRTTLSQLQEAGSSDVSEESRRVVHTLKGSAASISANSLAELCRQLEQQVLAGQPLEAAQLTQLDQTLSEVQGSIQQLLHQYGEAEQPAVGDVATSEVSQEKLRELQQLLQTRDFMAQPLLQELKPSISRQFGEAVFNQLSTAVDQFNFESAQRQLEQLLGEL